METTCVFELKRDLRLSWKTSTGREVLLRGFTSTCREKRKERRTKKCSRDAP